jgi:hypothetical protein
MAAQRQTLNASFGHRPEWAGDAPAAPSETVLAAPWHRGDSPESAAAPVQRKVGLEIEVPYTTLAKGEMKSASQMGGKDEIDETERSRLLPPGSFADDIESSNPLPYTPGRGDPAKGASIVAAAGWKLTADIVGGEAIVEFITDPFDETKDPTGLVVAAAAVAAKAKATILPLKSGEYRQLTKDTVLGRKVGGGVEGSIQVTGGVRPDRIIDLLDHLAKANGKPRNGDLKMEAGAKALLGTTVKSAKEASLDPKYQGLVALLAAYVAGQWGIREMITDGLKQRDRYDITGDSPLQAVDCVDADDILDFVLHGKVKGVAERREFQRRYGQDVGKFDKDLRKSLLQLMAPRAAKMRVPVLSRSSLGKLRAAVTIDDVNGFKRDVLVAAQAANGGLPGVLTAPLFPLGLDTPGHPARTIEAAPDISIERWLQSVLDGQNLKFSDETMGFEKVGPATGVACCFFEAREKGAVLETRALDSNQLVPMDEWEAFARKVVELHQALNAGT